MELPNALYADYISSSIQKLKFKNLYQNTAVSTQGGWTLLPKFKFSAKFPVGLHVILQIQIRKFKNGFYLMWKIILNKNLSRFNLEHLLK